MNPDRLPSGLHDGNALVGEPPLDGSLGTTDRGGELRRSQEAVRRPARHRPEDLRRLIRGNPAGNESVDESDGVGRVHAATAEGVARRAGRFGAEIAERAERG